MERNNWQYISCDLLPQEHNRRESHEMESMERKISLWEDSHRLRCSKLCIPLRGEQQATQEIVAKNAKKAEGR